MQIAGENILRFSNNHRIQVGQYGLLQTQKSPLGVNLVGFQDFCAVGSVTAAKRFGLAEFEWIAQLHVKFGFYPIQLCPVYLNVYQLSLFILT